MDHAVKKKDAKAVPVESNNAASATAIAKGNIGSASSNSFEAGGAPVGWNRKRRLHQQRLYGIDDSMTLAKKKKIRIEKALAKSAAIRIRLEKKKEKKLEEERRLDEEASHAFSSLEISENAGWNPFVSNKMVQ